MQSVGLKAIQQKLLYWLEQSKKGAGILSNSQKHSHIFSIHLKCTIRKATLPVCAITVILFSSRHYVSFQCLYLITFSDVQSSTPTFIVFLLYNENKGILFRSVLFFGPNTLRMNNYSQRKPMCHNLVQMTLPGWCCFLKMPKS